MIDQHRVVASIPARGGSTTVPRKNVRQLGGKPLVAWSIDVARETDAVDRTVVTTDDEEIGTVARDHGAEVLWRPDELATDDALVVDALRHMRDELALADDAVMAMLEPTCPFRSSEDVNRCLHRLVDDERDSVATFRDAEVNPHRTWEITNGVPETFVDDATPWLPRQALPDAYQLNGGCYAFRVDELPADGRSLLFGDVGAVKMPPERSVDIDTELDFRLAETILEETNR